MIQTDVTIAGGGPVGLTLAIALGRLGVRSILINDRLETTTHPKLDVVNCRSMEIFRQIGLSERIRDAGNPRRANQYSAIAAAASGPFYRVLKDRHIVYQPVADAQARIAATRDGTLPLEPMQRIAQMNLEPVLLAAARENPNADIRFGMRLYGFEQDATGVTVMAQAMNGDENIQIRSQYLVGCDGPNSRVRNFLNIDYEGTRDIVGELFIIHLRSREIARLYPNNEPYWHTWLSRPNFTGLLVSPDAGRDDYILHRPYPPVPGETLEGSVESALGANLAFQIVQSGPWRPQFLVAEAFGRRRVFVAGDATHQFMPTGGLGMNTGIAEAHNLAWKLAAVLRGWAGDGLLGSYEAERRPVALRNRDHVRKCAAAAFEINFARDTAMLDDTEAGRKARIKAGDAFEAKICRLYEALGIEIGYRYGSAVIAPDPFGAEPPEDIDYKPSAVCGARLPSVFLPDGTALFDHLSDDGFTLLALGAAERDVAIFIDAAASRGVPLHVVPINDDSIRALYLASLVLVRPDHHVCWRGMDGRQAGDVIDLVRGRKAAL